MENTLENKSKFFAQYWGQKIMSMTVNENDFAQTVGFTYMNKYKVENCHLELKPLSMISDAELKALPLDKSFKGEYSIKAGEIIWTKKSILIEVKVKTENRGSYYYQELRAPQFDILRSKGIALPWMGLPVEKLIDFGWVKLKKIENEN